jgi:hypothetical protein
VESIKSSPKKRRCSKNYYVSRKSVVFFFWNGHNVIIPEHDNEKLNRTIIVHSEFKIPTEFPLTHWDECENIISGSIRIRMLLGTHAVISNLKK